MPGFDWTPDLETGHQHIDDQHRGLFALANTLAACASCGPGETELVADAIYQLNDYVIEHFADEEDLMREAEYPRTAHHRALHEQLTASTMKLMTDYFNGEDIAAARIAPFVTEWLRRHIQADDRSFVEFLGRSPHHAE